MGDSFANGAQTAAYGFLFNYCLSYGCFNELKASLGRFFDSFNPQYTMTAQGAGSVSAHMLVAGASYSERLSVNINGQFCSAQQVCLRLGLGAQLSTGMQGSVSIKSGTNPATSGDITLFAGIGADVAVGISSFGGQGTVGTDSSQNIASGIPGAGVGYGASAGLDVCVQRVRSGTAPIKTTK